MPRIFYVLARDKWQRLVPEHEKSECPGTGHIVKFTEVLRDRTHVLLHAVILVLAQNH